MRIDKPGVYMTAGGKGVQITGIGEYLVSGYISRKKMLIWDRETGRLASKPKGSGNHMMIVRLAFK